MVEDTSIQRVKNVDPTLKDTLSDLIAWATSQKDAIVNTGSADSRPSWSIFGAIKTVTVESALPTVEKKGAYRLGQLAFAKDDGKLFQMTGTAEIISSDYVTLTWTHINEPGGSLFQYEMLRGVLSREKLESVYTNEYNKTDGRADMAMVAKLQLDWLSAFERDLRYRYRTAMRSRFHSGAIKRVEAANQGSIAIIGMFIKQAYAQLLQPPIADNNGVVPLNKINEASS